MFALFTDKHNVHDILHQLDHENMVITATIQGNIALCRCHHNVVLYIVYAFYCLIMRVHDHAYNLKVSIVVYNNYCFCPSFPSYNLVT